MSNLKLAFVIGMLAVTSIAVFGVVQPASAQSAASTGAATDLGSSSSAAAGDFFEGRSSSSSSAGEDSFAEAANGEARSSATR